jgi:hypothetical protein
MRTLARVMYFFVVEVNGELFALSPLSCKIPIVAHTVSNACHFFQFRKIFHLHLCFCFNV